MYTTIKVRLKLSAHAKQYLKQYEGIFQSEIQNITERMKLTKKISFRQQQIDRKIERYSQWNLYQLALRNYHAQENKKIFQYQRSSTWNTKSFYYYEGTLILYFGSAFPLPQLVLPLSMIKKEDEWLRIGRIIRLDIAHDEKFWYANFIVQTFDG